MPSQERERLHTDLEFSDYLKYQASTGEVRAGIESWLREALIVPFAYEASIENGIFTAFGQDLVEMARHGLSERIGQVGQARAEADLEGIQKIHSWLRDEARDGDLVVLLSPPGSEEEGFGANGQRRLTFTQFGMVRVQGGRKELRMVSIPEKEVTIGSQLGRLDSIWGNSISDWLGKVDRTDKGLVATPLFISKEHLNNGPDTYVRIQGKSSWETIETELQNGLALKEDEYAEQRRKSLIDTIAWQVMRYVDEKNSRRLNNIGLVARIVMAREAAGKYLKSRPEQIIDAYDEIENAMWVKEQLRTGTLIEKVKNGLGIWKAYQVIQNLRSQLRKETDVQEMLMGSSCGGGGIGNLLWEGGTTGRFGVQGSYIDSLASKAQGESTSVSSETMKCVKCPFCHKTVDAEVTSDKITCPECKASASRG